MKTTVLTMYKGTTYSGDYNMYEVYDGKIQAVRYVMQTVSSLVVTSIDSIEHNTKDGVVLAHVDLSDPTVLAVATSKDYKRLLVPVIETYQWHTTLGTGIIHKFSNSDNTLQTLYKTWFSPEINAATDFLMRMQEALLKVDFTDKEQVNMLYATPFTISFGQSSIMLHNSADTFYRIEKVIEEYIKEGLK